MSSEVTFLDRGYQWIGAQFTSVLSRPLFIGMVTRTKSITSGSIYFVSTTPGMNNIRHRNNRLRSQTWKWMTHRTTFGIILIIATQPPATLLTHWYTPLPTPRLPWPSKTSLIGERCPCYSVRWKSFVILCRLCTTQAPLSLPSHINYSSPMDRMGFLKRRSKVKRQRMWSPPWLQPGVPQRLPQLRWKTLGWTSSRVQILDRLDSTHMPSEYSLRPLPFR